MVRLPSAFRKWKHDLNQKHLKMIVKRESNPGDKHSLDHRNWIPAEHVQVNFSIGHDGSNIFLRYDVQEEQVRAVNTEFNSAVWEDSCVEFFFSFEEDDNYYNFEINAIGTVLGAYGKNRNERTWLPASLLKQIETRSSLGSEPFEANKDFNSWDIFIRIPIRVFCYNNHKDLSGKQGMANFYKCGDKLDKPHFLSWKPVETEKPDFHLPEFFGQLSFG